MIVENFALFLSSSVVAGLVAGFVAIRNSERRIQVENITQERAKWREKIRRISCDVHSAAFNHHADKLSALWLELSLNLNPTDPEDNGILCTLKELADTDSLNVKLAEFAQRVALLLKHDWERAKNETKPWLMGLIKPKRLSYAEYLLAYHANEGRKSE